MNKWEKLFWNGSHYLVVPNANVSESSCAQCAFNDKRGKVDLCPRYEGGPRGRLYCVTYERTMGKEAYLIPDTPESVADYIARSLSS